MASTKDWALKMIPVLIRWAQTSWDRTHYYSDLTKAIGLKTNQIGKMMGEVQSILNKYFKIGCQVCNKQSLPKTG